MGDTNSVQEMYSDEEGDDDGERRPASGTPRAGAPHARLAEEDQGGEVGAGGGPQSSQGQAGGFPAQRGQSSLISYSLRSPLFAAMHADRYSRQEIIKEYEVLTGATLIVMIDQIFAPNMTLLEELLVDADRSLPIHLLLASPGGDGETALRMVRSVQSRCSELTVIVPDMAKSAATLIVLGADHVLMGPGGDLGPVDAQFQIGRSLVGAKEIVAAVDEAEARIGDRPESYAFFASLLENVTMIMVEQARSAMARSSNLVREALSCATHRRPSDVDKLAEALHAPLIAETTYHGAAISGEQARSFGLPVEIADPTSDQWQILWALWTRYFTLGCWPNGAVAAYEGRRVSQIAPPLTTPPADE